MYRSNRFFYAQLIDDVAGKTLIASHTMEGKGAPKERAVEMGKALAKLAIGKGIKAVVFDRGGFIYTGNVKAFADGAREGGLEF